MFSFISWSFNSFPTFADYFLVICFLGKALCWVIKKLSPFIRRKKNEKRILIYNHIIQSLSPCVDFLREKDVDLIFNDVARQMGVTEREVEKALEFLENEGIVEKVRLKGTCVLYGGWIEPRFSYQLTDWFVANEFPSYFKYKASEERYKEKYHKAREILKQNCKSMSLKELISD